MQLEKVVRCFGEPASVVIPSTVREIGERAFAEVSSLEDLRFEEGVERIESSAFSNCCGLEGIVFPASLAVIGECAFANCRQLCEVTFAADSKLQYIGKKAFADCDLERVFLPASVTEIDPSAFSEEGWKVVSSRLLVTQYIVCSRDSGTLLKCVSHGRTVEVPAPTEVIGKRAFQGCSLVAIIFARGSRLREIEEEAFSHSCFKSFTVPSSVEILGDRCFEDSKYLSRVTFEEKSKLKKIGEQAFAGSKIQSITIPASVNEIDGSAFVGCPLEEIDIDPGNLTFIIRGNAIVTSDGTEIVRSFGFEREILVPSEVEVLQKSCFQSLKYLTELKFESGSKLRKICRSALSGCDSLRSIVVPASVIEIEESAFEGCLGLEECSIHKDAIHTKIGPMAFAGCCCLRSFYVRKNVEEIGANCFKKCHSLFQLKFGSGGTLKKIVRDGTLDEALEHLGFTEITSLFRIEVEDDDSESFFPG
jgi:hypothetical protein